MNFKRLVIALAAGTIATSAGAQSAAQPLNLKLPLDNASSERVGPAPAPDNSGHSTAAAVAATDASDAPAVPLAAAPGVADDGRSADYPGSTMPKCDDTTYGQPQVHGSTTVGVVGGNHISGNYQAADIDVYKAFGSCDHPSGGVGLSIDVGQGNFKGRRQHWRR